MLGNALNPQQETPPIDEKELQKLFKAVSGTLDIGDYDSFKSGMQTPDKRESFFQAVNKNGLDIGDYDTFEFRLSGNRNPIRSLYNVVHGDERYTKTFKEFKEKYSTTQSIDKLYNTLKEDGDYTRTNEEFYDKYFPTLKKRPAALPGDDISQSELLQLSKERKETKDYLSEMDKGNMQLQMIAGPGVKIMTGEDKKTRLGEINDRLKSAGYDETDADDIAGLPTGDLYGYNLKEILSLKKTNPERYKGYLASIKFQGGIIDRVEKEQSRGAAKEAMGVIRKIQNDTKGDYWKRRGDTRTLVSMANGDQGTIKNIADARAVVYGYMGATVNGFDPATKEFYNDTRYIANGGNLNTHQLIAMQFLEDTDPSTAKMYNRLLSGTPGEGLDDSKIGYDVKARELERMGLGLTLNSVKQILVDHPENKPLLNKWDELQNDIKTMNSRYPAAAQMDAQRTMQEGLGARNGVGKKYLLGIGDDVRDAGNWIGDILTSPFKSEESKALSDLELLGAKEFAQSAQLYQPENERLLGSDFIVNFSPELSGKINELQTNKELDYEDKASQVSKLIAENQDQVNYIPNDKSNKANFTTKAIFSNVGSVASQLTSQIGLAYLMGGAGDAGKARQLSTLFGSTYATTYDDFYSEAIRNNIKNPSTYATIHSGIEAASELINNDFVMAKRIIGGKGVLGAILDNTTEAVWNNARKTGLWKAVGQTIKTAGINALQETEEEVAGQFAQNAIDNYAFDQDVSFTDGVSDAAITTMAAMLPLGIIGLPFKYRDVSRNRKYAMYEIGSNPDRFMKGIETDLASGAINQKQADERKVMVEKAAKAVDGSLLFKMDGTPLTDNEKTESAFNQLALESLDEQEKKAPSAIKTQMQQTRNEIEAKQVAIISPSDVSRNQFTNVVEINTEKNKVESVVSPDGKEAEISDRLPQEELRGGNGLYSQEQEIQTGLGEGTRENETQLKESSPAYERGALTEPTNLQTEETIVLDDEGTAVLSVLHNGLNDKPTQEQVKTHLERIKPITDTIRSAAKRIREFEMKDDQGEKVTGALSDISAIPRHIMAKGLEIVAEVLDNGASIADALKSAVDFIKKAQPNADELQVRDSVGNYIESLFPENSSDRKGVKVAIKSVTQTGKIKGEKVTLTPRQALHKQIRDVARGAKTGFKIGTAEQKAKHKEMTENIQSLLTNAKNKQHISSSQWNTLFKKANDIGTSGKRFNKFADFVDKVLNDADYQAKLDHATNLQSKISKGAKSKAYDRSAYTNQSVKRFARIDPSQVENIDEYNAIAGKIVPVAEGIKATVKKGVAETKNEVFGTDKQAIDDYIEKYEQYRIEKAKQQLVEDYSDMVAQGIIDPDTMSLKEMQGLVDAVHGNSPDNEMKAADLFNNQQLKLEALRSAVDYNRIALEDNPAFSEKENEIVRQLKEIDIDRLDAVQLAKLNDVINNIVINNDFTGSQAMAIISGAQKSITEAQDAVKAEGINSLGSIRSALAQGFASIALQHDFIFKSTKLASLIQHLSGASAIFDGHARAKLLQDEVITAYQKLKGKMSGDIDAPVNRVRRGILADVMNNFGGSVEEIEAEFKRRKNWIKQTGERLEQSGDKEESAEGKLILQVYDELLSTSNSTGDVILKSSKDNIKLVDFWRNKYDERREKTQLNAELLNNKVWEDVEGYTATKLKEPGGLVGMDKEDLKEVFSNSYQQEKLTQQIAGSKNKKVRSANLPEGKVLNLDFDNVQSKVFYRTNYDVETSEAIEKVRNFFADKRTDRLFGGIGNKKVVMNSIAEAVNAQRGQLPPSSAADKIVNSVTDIVRLKGVRIALGSVSQVVKQFPSVAVNTVVNLGTDAYLFGKAFMVSNKIALFNEFAIGLRGDTQAGFNKDVKLGEITAAKFSFSLTTPLVRIKDKTDKLTDLIMAALVQSDVSVARTSWLAYYMQDLKRQGVDIDKVDWENEHLNPNYEAAAYAEQQVSRTQNPNDVSSGSAFYRDAKGTAGFFKNLVLPFSTFVVNARVRMTNDVQKILYGGNKAEAYKSLAGTVAEMVAFNAVKTYLIATLTTMGARGVASLFGMWDDDEAKAENKEQLTLETQFGETNISAKTKRLVANATSDFFFSGLGSLTQSTANQGINALYKMAVTEYYADGQMNKYPSLFYSRSDTDKTPDYSSYGLYGTLATKVAAMKNSARYSLTGTYSGVDSNYKDIEVELTEEERRLYTLSFIVDAFGIAGLSDADILTLNQKLKWIADRKMADKYGVQDKLMERNVKPR